MIIEMLALALFAQDGNLWTRGTDPATSAGGIHHVGTDIYITCVPQSGIVHITMPGQPAYRLEVTSGDRRAKMLKMDTSSGNSHMMFDAADPVLEAAASADILKVGIKRLDFSDRDRANYKLLVTRICRKPAE